ncbi:MAG: hypothetical protein ACRD2L_10690 [Terriglobia bacterium]
MSTPVNAALNLQTRALLTPEQLSVNSIFQDYASPYLRLNNFDLTPIRIQPAAAQSAESVDLHGDDGSTIGTVSYTPGDFASMQAAAERLMKEGNQEDYLQGQKLMQKAFQILQVEILKMQLEQQIFNSVVQALQRAAG